MRPACRLAAGALAALISACATPPPTAPARPALTLERCGIAELMEPLQCGDLEVPENRAQPEGRQLSLNVVILPASGERTLPPLYDLAGGPGIGATSAARYWATDGAVHRAHRDIVLLDQRGTGQSGALRCQVHLASPYAPVLDAKDVAACREKLEKTADLSQYSTAAAVADLELLRAQLGHERIDLHAMSYGTRLAQEYLRAYPQRVRAMVLIGTVSPEDKVPLPFAVNAQAVLARLILECNEDKACRRAVPDLAGDIGKLQRKLGIGPLPAALADGTRVQLAAGPFWEAVRAQLLSTTSQRRLPWLLHEAAAGRIAPLLEAMMPSGTGALGLLLSVSCPEDTLHITDEELAPARATVFGDYRIQQQRAACAAWGVPPRPEQRAFVDSDVPALLMAGDMDPATPPASALAVASHLPNSRVVVVPKLAHLPEGLSHMACFETIINAFFMSGTAKNLDLGCLKRMQPPRFATKAPA